MTRLSRHRPPHVAQGTWRSGALHVWGWNGVDTASMAWLYSGFRTLNADGTRSGWHDSPISYGAIARISIDIPQRPALHAASVQLDPLGTAVWLSELPADGDIVSDSIAWFATGGRAGPPHGVGRADVADRRRRGPVHGGSVDPGDRRRDRRTARHRSTPRSHHICTAGSGHDTRKIFELMVDGVARSYLFQGGWKADVGRGRKGSTQALRAVFGALAKPDHVVRGGTTEFDLALGQLRDELDRHRRRLSGEPVVIPRVRLLMSHDPHDPWEVRLELVDDTDSMRWCTAADLWDRNDRAIEVAREARHLDTLVVAARRRRRTDRSGRPRARRPRLRARTDWRRTRPRNGRGLHRRRAVRAREGRRRADRAGATDPQHRAGRRRGDTDPAGRSQEAVRP